MKILMLCDFFDENMQYQENLLTDYYLKNGLSVFIVTSEYTSIFDYYSNTKKKPNQETFLEKNNSIVRQPYSFDFYRVRKIKRFKKILDQEKPDYIYIHSLPLNLIEATGYKKKNPNCKIIFDFHGDYSNSASNWLSLNILHKVFYRFIYRLFYKGIDKIFYITPNGGKFLNEVYGIPQHRMKLLPLGVDIDYINNLKLQKKNDIIRKNLQINENDFVIFTGGKLAKEKQTDLVIKSFLQINNESVHLVIVGDTKDSKYKELITNLINAHQRIHFIGWVEGKKVHEYMLACDVAVFPSSQSVLWQQSIGCGLPLIIGLSENQDATYLNRNENIIFLKETITTQTISDSIRTLIDNKNMLLKMKQNATKTATEYLSYNIIVHNTLC